MDATFDATAELQHIRVIREIGRRTAYKQSKLEKFRAELVALHNQGGSLSELQSWLRIQKRTKTARSTISRYLKRLPELENQNGKNNNV